MNERVKAALEPGETLKWQGRPGADVRLKNEGYLKTMGAVLLTLCGLWVCGSLIAALTVFPPAAAALAVGGIAAVLIYRYTLGQIARARIRERRSDYLVTDRRLVILRPDGVTESLERTKIRSVRRGSVCGQPCLEITGSETLTLYNIDAASAAQALCGAGAETEE